MLLEGMNARRAILPDSSYVPRQPPVSSSRVCCFADAPPLLQGILVLRRRSYLRPPVGARVGPHRAQACLAWRPAGFDAVDDRVRAIDEILGPHPQSVRGGRPQREYRRVEEHDGGDHGLDEPCKRLCIPAYDLVAGEHDRVGCL